ncbi:MAG TPA: lysine-2,3-aminomutase-like protein [Xanthobacteraceae bacterium]|jgi:lysine 2,3-aminomutase|nr:lysine-2,3-aminomutase-like protein [Xanthobacteraceae bacterium]
MTSSARTLRSARDLHEARLVPAEQLAELEKVTSRYAVAITPAMADLIDPTDSNDPIARQFVPRAGELEVRAEERADPIGDDAHTPVEGIVHRYPDRVLLKLVHVCAVYCRYCFRREMVGPQSSNALSASALTAALDYIRSNNEIWEVILTGGDPFVLSPRRLGHVMEQLAAIDHVKVIRIHTRVPIAEPKRMTAALVKALNVNGKAVYVVVHANHPRELTSEARAACAKLVDAGIPLLSQSVLLRGVNDHATTLGDLMRAFVENRIKPYYLHHGDLAPGTSEFRTELEDGQALMRHLRGRYSGLCQPTYVLDIPGGYGKSPVGPNYLTCVGADSFDVEDFNGGRHVYPPRCEK